jgi:hypothetical protein
MAIPVTVTKQCGRCKRKEHVTISSDQVAAFEKAEEEHAARRTKVNRFVEENGDALPDLVVIFKGKVQMISEVCDAYCARTVQNNIDPLFRERKPRVVRTPEERAAAKAEKAAKKLAEQAAKAAAEGNGAKDSKTSAPAKSGKGKGKTASPAS